MPHNFKLISIVCILLSLHIKAFAQKNIISYPNSINQRIQYEIMIEIPKAYISGLLIMHKPSEECVNASVVNEFGISLMDFSYNEHKNKIKFHNLTYKLNKWYIKRTLRNDMKNVLKSMQCGSNEYINTKRKIKYYFNLVNETE